MIREQRDNEISRILAEIRVNLLTIKNPIVLERCFQESVEFSKAILECLEKIIKELQEIKISVIDKKILNEKQRQLEQISTRVSELEKFIESLLLQLNLIINYMNETLKKTTNALENATELTRRDIIEKIITLQREIEEEKSLLETLVKLMSKVKQIEEKVSLRNRNHLKNMVKEASSNTNNLKMIKEYLESLIFHQRTKNIIKINHEKLTELANVI